METAFLASPDALEVIVVTHSHSVSTDLTDVMIPIEDLTDVTLAIEDTDEDDEDDEEDLTDLILVSDDTY